MATSLYRWGNWWVKGKVTQQRSVRIVLEAKHFDPTNPRTIHSIDIVCWLHSVSGRYIGRSVEWRTSSFRTKPWLLSVILCLDLCNTKTCIEDPPPQLLHTQLSTSLPLQSPGTSSYSPVNAAQKLPSQPRSLSFHRSSGWNYPTFDS